MNEDNILLCQKFFLIMWIDFPLRMYGVSAVITLQLILSWSELVEERLAYFKSEFHVHHSSFIYVTYMMVHECTGHDGCLITGFSAGMCFSSKSMNLFFTFFLFIELTGEATTSHIYDILWPENYVAKRGGGKTVEQLQNCNVSHKDVKILHFQLQRTTLVINVNRAVQRAEAREW